MLDANLIVNVNTPFPSNASLQRNGGFTLVEVLVATLVSSIVLAILLYATSLATDSWKNSREKVRASRQAKIALDQMARDFESMQVRMGKDLEWLYIGIDEQGSSVGAKVALFTGATDRYNGQVGVGGIDKGGDVSAVAYRLLFKEPISNSGDEFAVYALYRNLMDPSIAFDDVLGKEKLLETGGDAGPFKEHFDQIGDVSNFVCENILELSVAFLIQYKGTDGSSLVDKQKRITVVDTSGGQLPEEVRIKGSGITFQPAIAEEEAIGRGRLVSAELSVSVITDSAMSAIRENRITAEELEDYISKNTYKYTKVVQLPSL